MFDLHKKIESINSNGKSFSDICARWIFMKISVITNHNIIVFMLQGPNCRHFSDKEAQETTSKCYAWVSHWYPWAICHTDKLPWTKTLHNFQYPPFIGTWLWRKWRWWLLRHMGRLLWHWRWQWRKETIGYLPETENQFWKVCPKTKQSQWSQRSDLLTTRQHILWPSDHPDWQVYPGKLFLSLQRDSWFCFIFTWGINFETIRIIRLIWELCAQNSA